MSYNLADYGYADGGYIGGHCCDCDKVLEMTTKRAWRCKECAISVQREAEAPLICDLRTSEA